MTSEELKMTNSKSVDTGTVQGSVDRKDFLVATPKSSVQTPKANGSQTRRGQEQAMPKQSSGASE